MAGLCAVADANGDGGDTAADNDVEGDYINVGDDDGDDKDHDDDDTTMMTMMMTMMLMTTTRQGYLPPYGTMVMDDEISGFRSVYGASAWCMHMDHETQMILHIPKKMPMCLVQMQHPKTHLR